MSVITFKRCHGVRWLSDAYAISQWNLGWARTCAFHGYISTSISLHGAVVSWGSLNAVWTAMNQSYWWWYYASLISVGSQLFHGDVWHCGEWQRGSGQRTERFLTLRNLLVKLCSVPYTCDSQHVKSWCRRRISVSPWNCLLCCGTGIRAAWNSVSPGN